MFELKKKAGFLGILLIFVSLILNYTGNVFATSLFETKCGVVISSSGEWEMLRDLVRCGDASGSFGLGINASHVVLDCRGRGIEGIDNSTLENYGIFVEDGLQNITIVNCEIFGFRNAIFVNGGTSARIVDSNAEARGECVMGNWEDFGNNVGCLDIRGPEISVVNQTVLFGRSFVYRISASDISGVIGYGVREEGAGGNEIFNISKAGVISNISAFEARNYSLIVSAKDGRNQTSEEKFYVFVLGGNLGNGLNNSLNNTNGTIPGNQTIPEVNNTINSTLNLTLPGNNSTNQTTTNSTQNNTTSNTNSNSESSSDSTTAQKEEIIIPQCANAEEAWDCGAWSSCVNGTINRTCTRKNVNCYFAKPKVKENCTLPACEENWNCSWSGCLNGTKTALVCSDINSCNTTKKKPINETCEVLNNSLVDVNSTSENDTIIGRSFLTGAVIGVWGGIKSNGGNAFSWLKEKGIGRIILIIGIVFIIALAAGFVFFRIRNKSRSNYVPELDLKYFEKMSKKSLN